MLVMRWWDMESPAISWWSYLCMYCLEIGLEKNLETSTNCSLTALSSKLPIYDELCRRVVNFHFACLNSDNNIIRCLCRYLVISDSAQSPHGCNIRHISEKFSLSFHCFSEPNSCRHARSLLVEHCYEQYTHVDVDQLSVLREMLMIRNQVADFLSFSWLF